MTDREYAKQKANIKRYLKKWDDLVYSWTFYHDFQRHYENDSEFSKCASVASHWEYKKAYFTWYMPMFDGKDDDYVEDAVVHELSHVLISATQNFETPQDRQMTEYATTCVAEALRRLRA